MNILVTGASGFIGRYLVEELAKTPAYNIFCLVRQTSNITRLGPLGVKFIYADITDYESLSSQPWPEIDVLFHCAAYLGNQDREKLDKVNIQGTENICKLALERSVGRLVYTSTIGTISGNEQAPLTDASPYKASLPYGEAKIEAEKIALDYRQAGLKVAIIRPCMVYGPDEPHLLGLLLKMLKCRLYPIINQGRAKFHLVYVKTVVDALIFAMNNDKCLEGTFIIADKEVLTNKEAMSIMAQAIGAKPSWELPVCLSNIALKLPFIGKRLKFFQKDRWYSTERLESLGFRFRYQAQPSLFESCQKFAARG